MALIWIIEIAAIIFVGARIVRRMPRVAFYLSEIMVLVLVFNLIMYQCLYVEVPFDLYDAPYGQTARARDLVESMNGRFGKVEGEMYHIILRGPEIDDKALSRLQPFLKHLETSVVFLEQTSVTCTGARAFCDSMPHPCSMATDIPNCNVIPWRRTDDELVTNASGK